MKYVLTLVICVSFYNLFAQKQSDPFKKANIIFIETGLSGKDAFVAWGKHLGQSGFSIDKSDVTFQTLTTGTKAPKKFNIEYYLICAVSDSGIIKIKTKLRVPPSALLKFEGTEFIDWEYSASKATTTNSVFIDIKDILNSFGQYTIKYDKE